MSGHRETVLPLDWVLIGDFVNAAIAGIPDMAGRKDFEARWQAKGGGRGRGTLTKLYSGRHITGAKLTIASKALDLPFDALARIGDPKDDLADLQIPWPEVQAWLLRRLPSREVREAPPEKRTVTG